MGIAARRLRWVFIGLLAVLFRAAAVDIVLDGALPGRVFEGLGGVSAGASTRLLIDYPPAQRAEILDYLFKPGFGASLQHLKVEVGGDVNSTDGTEPSHMRVAGEENYERGWEWWLMREAQNRNPDLTLDALCWGAPGWVGSGEFYSPETADYLAKFLTGALREHGLVIRTLGIWNEKPYSIDWIKLLRRRLDETGWTAVGIVAADEWDQPWRIAGDMLADPEFAAAIHAIGVHYPHSIGSPLALQTGKPLWASEDGTGGGTGASPWESARRLARIYNRNYTDAHITKTEIWSPVSAYYDSLPYNDSGLMRANTPWSGFYEVLPAIWVTAHTTQFAKPGWIYLDGQASARLPFGGSIVTLRSPDGSDFSTVIETIDSGIAQTLVLHATNGIPRVPLQLWRTRDGESFAHLESVPVTNDGWSFTVDPECIYTLSTTTGQSRGSTQPPSPQPLGLPYQDEFEQGAVHSLPAGFIDQGGAFETEDRDDGDGRLLRQQLQQTGIEWYYPQTQAFTLTGDSNWTDYEVSVLARLPVAGEAALLGRIGPTPPPPAAPNAYSLVMLHSSNGTGDRFELRGPSSTLATGALDPIGTNWHSLRLRLQGASIRAWVDNRVVADLQDATLAAGRVGVGSGWHTADFDRLQVRRLPRAAQNLARNAVATASSTWSGDYTADRAIDGNPASRWNSAPVPGLVEWIQLTFSRDTRINRIELAEYGERIRAYQIQHWDGNHWITDITGDVLPMQATLTLPEITTSQVRLLVTSMTDAISIEEFGVYDDVSGGTPVRISEWMLHNVTALRDPADDRFKPWIELWNSGSQPADLGGFHLSDDPTDPLKGSLPSGTVLAPGERRVVWCGRPVNMSPVNQDLHVDILPMEQGTIGLYSPEGSPVEVIDLDRQEVDRSRGISDAASDAVIDLIRPTPGTANTPLIALPVSWDTQRSRLVLAFRGQPFTSHRIETSTHAAGGDWQELGNLDSDADGAFHLQVSPSPVDRQFFRAVEQQ